MSAHESTLQESNNNRDLSATSLLSILANDVSELLRGEMHLARAEVKQSVDDVKTGLISIGGGAAVLLAGVLTLIAFLVLGFANWFELQMWVSALIVGAVATLIGFLMVKGGGSKFSADSLTPSRTQAAMAKDKHMIEEKLS